jgi:uncharacterized protein YjbI with pentapeptide repeats
MTCLFPGLPKRNPGLELANAFSVNYQLAIGKGSDLREVDLREVDLGEVDLWRH